MPPKEFEIPLYFGLCPPDSLTEGRVDITNPDPRSRVRYLTALSTIVKYTHPPYLRYLSFHEGMVRSQLEAEAISEEVKFLYPATRVNISPLSVAHGRLWFANRLFVPEADPNQLNRIVDHLVDLELGSAFEPYDSADQFKREWHNWLRVTGAVDRFAKKMDSRSGV